MTSPPRAAALFDAADVPPDLVAAWDDLAACASTPNPFYESWMLLPALRHLGESDGVRLAVVRDPHEPSRLDAVVPVRFRRGYRGLPLRVASLWRHRHCFLCAPLIRAGREAEAWPALIDLVGGQAGLLELSLFPTDDASHAALQAVLGARSLPTFVDHLFARPVLPAAGDAEAYFRENVSSGLRKRVRQGMRRLAEGGEVRHVRLSAADDLGPWLEKFLAVESSGWKGRDGTALASDPRDAGFFTEAARAAHARGKLTMNDLRAGERTVAADCNFLAGTMLFGFKVGIDESYADVSPGVLLEAEGARAAFDHPRVAAVDSCIDVTNDSSPLSRLYAQRRTLGSMVCGLGAWGAGLLVRSLPGARSAWRRIKGGTGLAARAASIP